MDLIDILNAIYNTKIELKDVIGEDKDEFSRLPVSVHNYLVDCYNNGYIVKYAEKWKELSGGEDITVVGPRIHLDYNELDPTYSDYDIEILCDIMTSVYQRRLMIRDEINTDNEYFPDYPDILLVKAAEMTALGESEGEEDAQDDYNDGSSLLRPTITSRNNQVIITASNENSIIYYSIGTPGGPYYIYNGPINLGGDAVIYAYEKRGRRESEKQNYSFVYSGGSGGEEIVIPAPVIYRVNNSVSIRCDDANAVIFYSNTQNGSYTRYTKELQVPESGLTVYAYARRGDNVSSISFDNFSYISDGSVILPTPSIEALNGYCFRVYSNSDNPDVDLYIIMNGSESDPGEIIANEDVVYVDEDTSIIMWNELDGNTSDRYRTVFKYDYVDPTIVYPPTINYADNTVVISAANTNDYIIYKLGYYGEETPYTGEIKISDDVNVYAQALRGGQFSEWAGPVYCKFIPENGVYVKAVDIQCVGNLVTMTSENGNNSSIWFTMDGSDPTLPGALNYQYYFNDNGGIYITKDTLIKAAAYLNDHWSEVSEKICLYEIDDNFYNIPLYVQGSNSVNINYLSDMQNNIYYIEYSTDMITWSKVGLNGANGLPESGYYLRSSREIPMRLFNKISFGGNNVSLSGNILSLIYSSNFRDKDTILWTNYFEGTFKNDTNIVSIKNLVLGAVNLEASCYKEMFAGCSGLVDGLSQLPATNLKSMCYQRMFSGCSSMTNAPEIMAEEIVRYSCNSLFEGCSSIITLPAFRFTSIEDYGCSKMFKGCSNLVSFDNILQCSSIGVRSCEEMFSGCSSLTNGLKIISENVNDYSFSEMYKGCSSLVKGGELNIDSFGFYSCNSMFEDCISLTEAPLISATSVNEGSCYRMFKGCSSLEEAPELFSRVLQSYCYFEMFMNCTSLRYINAHFIEYTSYWNTMNWVYNVGPSGIFIQDKDANWYDVSDHAIPPAWVGILPEEDKVESPIIVFSNTNTNYDNLVTINKIDNNDVVWYKINDGQWRLYENSFKIEYDCTVYAKSIRDGKESDVSEKSLTARVGYVDYAINGNKVILSSRGSVSKIWYRTWDPDNERWNDVYQYSGPIVIDRFTEFEVWPELNGKTGNSYTFRSEPVISPCTISCEDNIITISCDTYYNRIIYRVGESGPWSDYIGPFNITSDCRVYAQARGEYNDGPETYMDCIYDEDGLSYSVRIKRVSKLNNSNTIQIITEKSGDITNEDIHVYYRINNGEWKEYLNYFNITSDSVIDCYVVGKEYTSPISTYNFEYDENHPVINVMTPYVYNEEHLPNHGDRIYFKTDTENCTINLYLSDIVMESGHENEAPRNKSGLSNSLVDILLSYVLSCTIKAQAANHNNGSFSDYFIYNYVQGDVPVVIPDPVIHFNNNNISITGPAGSNILYRITDNNGAWSRWSPYGVPIHINYNVRIEAYATNGGLSSNTVSRTCEYNGGGDVPPVVVIPDPVINYTNNTITISVNGNYTIKYRYTMRGGSWTNWFNYSGWPISVEYTLVIESYATDGNNVSNTISRICTYVPVVIPDAPTISFENNVITITNPNAGGTIYYTFDNQYVEYTGPITISLSGTIWAYVEMDGQRSSITELQYTTVIDNAPDILCVDNLVFIYNTKENENNGYEIYYSFDNQTFTRYTDRFEIDSNKTVYAYNSYNGSISSTINKYCVYTNSPGEHELQITALENGSLYIGPDDCYHASYTSLEININDGGWTSFTTAHDGFSDMSTFNIQSGDIVKLRGNNTNMRLAAKDGYSATNVVIHNTGRYIASGYITSLTKGSNYLTDNTLQGDYAFAKLFQWYVINGNNGDNKLNELIDATYIKFPTNTSDYCYWFMFMGRGNADINKGSKLIHAPKILPANTLSDHCYSTMFQNNIGLVDSPELPATTLISWSYYHMFYYCVRLKYIKCLATDISAFNCTHDWTWGINERDGLFIKNPNMNNWIVNTPYSYDDGIPVGWTVQDATI